MPITFANLTLYNLKELSEKLHVHIATLRVYVRTGRLRGKKLGTKWYISEDSLRDYFQTASPAKGKNPPRSRPSKARSKRKPAQGQ